MTTYNVNIRLRRDTAANWTSNNPTLALGEAGWETDTGYLKIGDGATLWNALAYLKQQAADVTIADAGNLIAATNAETALAELAGAIDSAESSIAALDGSKITVNDLYVYTRDLDADSSDARAIAGVTLESGDTVLWRGYSTRPVNMGINDVWLGPPGEAYQEKTASYTGVLTDGATLIGMNAAGANTFTIPANASVAYPVGTKLLVAQIGAGVTTIQGATGVSVNGTSAGSVVLERWQIGVAHKIGTDAWVVRLSFPDTGLTSADIDVTVQAYDVDTLKADVSRQLNVGFSSVLDNDGTQSSGTYTPSIAGGNYKTILNNGAFTLAPPGLPTNAAVSFAALVRNGATAGTITTSGFTIVKGDSFTTTDGHEFICHIDVFDLAGTEWSCLTIVALQ